MKFSCIGYTFRVQQLAKSFAFGYHVGDQLVDILGRCVSWLRLRLSWSILFD